MTFYSALAEHQAVIAGLRALTPLLEEIAKVVTHRLRTGGKIAWMGNGGSAADCQHFAAELAGRFELDRGALASLALTTDSSVLTAIANDFGFEHVFARQVQALCRPKDVLVGISTSGRSENVLNAFAAGRALGAYCVALTGQGGRSLTKYVDACLVVPSARTARVQEAHILLGHMLCERLELSLATDSACAGGDGSGEVVGQVPESRTTRSS